MKGALSGKGTGYEKANWGEHGLMNKIISFVLDSQPSLHPARPPRLLIGVGVWSASANFPIDAVPDVTTGAGAKINTRRSDARPAEVERQITYRWKWRCQGYRTCRKTRSISQFGLSQVTAVFR